jgi:hypothetical protein
VGLGHLPGDLASYLLEFRFVRDTPSTPAAKSSTFACSSWCSFLRMSAPIVCFHTVDTHQLFQTSLSAFSILASSEDLAKLCDITRTLHAIVDIVTKFTLFL